MWGVWIVVAIAAAAVILILVVGRSPEPGADRAATAVTEDGLVVDGTAIRWSSIFEIVVVTRRQLGGTWYGFEVRTEELGLVVVEGRNGLGEAFLAQSYRFPGFDHRLAHQTLSRRRARAVCYRR